MLFKEIFLDLRNSKNEDPHPMWNLFKKDQFQLSQKLVDSFTITDDQKNKLNYFLNNHEELFKVLGMDEKMFDEQFWLNFFLGVRDQGCKSSSCPDIPVHISCSGDLRSMSWSQINALVTKDYEDNLDSQIAIPEVRIEAEDKNELSIAIQNDFEKRVNKEKSVEEREKIKKEMKNTGKAKHLHEIRARDAEFKVMNNLLQFYKVWFS